MTSTTISGTDRPPLPRPRCSKDNDGLPVTCDATIAASRAEILKELAASESKTTAVSVALVNNERLLWAEAFGSIDRTRGLAATAETLFCIASCSKVIAAVAVMITNSMGIGSIAISLAERILLHALAEQGSNVGVPVPLEPRTLPASPVSDGELAAITGIYANSYGLQRLDACVDHTLTLSNFVNDHWHPFLEGLRLRRDGRFVADSNPIRAYRVFVAEGRRYLAVRSPYGMGHYEMELPVGHELPPGKPLSGRWQARVGRRWLTANEPYSAFLALGRQPPLVSLAEVQGLEGYLAVSLRSAGFDLVQVVDPRESDHVARMCLKIPLDNGWGLSELAIEERDGEEWLLWCGTRYRPLETVPTLGSGNGTVRIGHQGFGKWFRWPAAASVLTLTGARSWYLYDAEFGLKDWGMEEKESTVGVVDDDFYLVLYGAPDTTITLTVQPRELREES